MEHQKISVTAQHECTACCQSATDKKGAEHIHLIFPEPLTLKTTDTFGIFSDMLFYY